MGFKERLASANQAARDVRDEGRDKREDVRERLKSDWQDAKRARSESDRAARDTYAATKEQIASDRDERSSRQRVKDGTCPNCGGHQFTAKRSVKGKLSVGLLAAKSQVKCVTCGQMFKRG